MDQENNDLKGYAVVDLETTGRNATRDQIIEIGVVLSDLNGKVTDTIHTLVRPSVYIEAESTRIHGIDEQMVRHSPTLEMLASQVIGLFESRILVAHNAPFEARFLTAGLANYGVEITTANFVDTLKLSRGFLKLQNNKLPTVAKHYNVALENPHVALNDAYATALILQKMIADQSIPRSAFQASPFYADDYEDVVYNSDWWKPRDPSQI